MEDRQDSPNGGRAAPRTPLPVLIVVVGAGVAYAEGAFANHILRLLPLLAALLIAVLLQVGANLVNDVADFERGTDTGERLGPTRVTQTGLLTPKQVWLFAALTFGVAALAGLYLVILSGWVALVIGVFSILAAYLYSVGPAPMAQYGFGDLFVWIFFGYTGVCGTVYVLLGWVPAAAWLAATGVGALVTAILVVNNIRDIQTDKQAGRRNIPVVLGRRAGEIEYGLLLGCAALVPMMLVLLKWSSPWVPACIPWVRRLKTAGRRPVRYMSFPI